MSNFSVKNCVLTYNKKLAGSLFVIFSFMLLSFMIVKFLAPDLGSNAATQNASETVGPYTLSMSNDSVANVDITPTASQQIFTTTNNLTLSNSCSQGATISISTNSTTSNDLTRNGTDSATKIIPATTGSSLLDNTWGFSTDGGTTYNPVPVKGGTATYVYDAVEAATNKNIPVQFGIKTDSSLPSGTYTTDVVYTAAVKSGCLTYSLAWDLNGGTGKSGTSYATSNVNWGTTFDLTNYTPTRDGYTFTGWSNGSSTFTGSEVAANLNPTNAGNRTMTAQWSLASYTKTFSYTGAAQTWTVPYTGNYKVELWGAQGGWYVDAGATQTSFGGKGGYVQGTTSANKDTALYVYVGGYGYSQSGWNGGGTGNAATAYGGGATDIRTTSGAWNAAAGLRSRIIVAAGGGGGAGWQQNGGGAGGGLTGEDGYTPGTNCDSFNYPLRTPAKGGNQTAGGAGLTCSGTCMHTISHNGSFGIGAADAEKGGSSPSVYISGGGGGGWYGGGSGATTNCHIMGSAGGSSYISGHTGSVAVTSTSSSSPKSGCTTGTTSNACSISPYGYTFTNTTMVDGQGYNWTNTKGSRTNMPTTSGSGTEVGHAGSGYAKITWLGV